MPFQILSRRVLTGWLTLAAPLVCGAAAVKFAQPEQPPKLELRLNCRFGENYFIQQYVNMMQDRAPKISAVGQGLMTAIGPFAWGAAPGTRSGGKSLCRIKRRLRLPTIHRIDLDLR